MKTQKVYRRGYEGFWIVSDSKLRVGLKDGVYSFYTIDSFGLLTAVSPERFEQLLGN